jgi:outer membrane protein OmpA-like peptidoglycan-associated protein
MEGKLTRITYRAPAQRLSLEVSRNYEQALKDAKFALASAAGARNAAGVTSITRLLRKATTTASGNTPSSATWPASSRGGGRRLRLLYVVMQGRRRPDKDRVRIQLDVVEPRPMEQRMVVVDASAMQRDLAVGGRVAVYGILFDFDKDAMRPDSKPQLDEIAKLLKGNPGLKVLIVGHTDAKGALDYNRDLSQRRARSIVEALARLRHRAGAADAARRRHGGPVATNRSDQAVPSTAASNSSMPAR